LPKQVTGYSVSQKTNESVKTYSQISRLNWSSGSGLLDNTKIDLPTSFSGQTLNLSFIYDPEVSVYLQKKEYPYSKVTVTKECVVACSLFYPTSAG